MQRSLLCPLSRLIGPSAVWGGEAVLARGGSKMDEQQIIADARAWYHEAWDPNLSVGEWFRLMYESGWGYPTWPERWGGKGLPTSGAKLVRAERRAAGAL